MCSPVSLMHGKFSIDESKVKRPGDLERSPSLEWKNLLTRFDSSSSQVWVRQVHSWLSCLRMDLFLWQRLRIEKQKGR